MNGLFRILGGVWENYNWPKDGGQLAGWVSNPSAAARYFMRSLGYQTMTSL